MDYLRVSVWCYLISAGYGAFYNNLFAVHIEGGARRARSVAEETGFTFIDTIMDDHYHFRHHEVTRRSTELSPQHHNILQDHPEVLWFAQQEIKIRKKRDLQTFNDEQFKHQWYLHGPSRPESLSMNVQGAWSHGYTGRGVVVTVLDDGIERTHPDLRTNYDPRASWDINGQDNDPTPYYDFTNENKHGTRCAGEVAAAANNSVCGVGVAHEASIGGIRMLDGDVTDSVEAMSLALNRNHIDIYSASWGPDDDGKTMDGPATLTRRAFREGVAKGRRGKGSIFVWASGNGGSHHDNCNCDGYTNSIYTLSVSSATEKGRVPWYSEACSSTLVSTFSSGDHEEKQVTTTDLRRQCTNLHTGTSASAPLAAGIVALTLQANPNLTWRDVQYISVLAASSEGLSAGDWVTNGAGHKVSHHFGFGMMNAGKMVELAANWTNVPEQRVCEVSSPNKNVMISPKQTQTLTLTTRGCRGSDHEVVYLEHVQAKISLTSSWRGDIQIWLTSPSGTRSNLLSSRVNDDSGMGFNEWEFLTTHNWGETSQGEWTLEISNGYRAGKAATLKSWSLVLFGTLTDPQHTEPVTQSTTRQTIKDTYAKTGVILPNIPTFNERMPTSQPDVTAPHEELEIVNHIPTLVSEPTDVWTKTNVDSEEPISNNINMDPDKDVGCPMGSYYHKDQCVENCPNGYYADRVPNHNLVCFPCHSTCAACTGAHNFTCSECYVGAKLRNGECIKQSAANLRTGSSKTMGLSDRGLKSMVYGASSALGLLVIVLVSLLIYYIHHQRKNKSRRHMITNTTTAPVYSPVTRTEILTGSQHSSQQELMDSDMEVSSQGSNQGKPCITSIDYRFSHHPGQQV